MAGFADQMSPQPDAVQAGPPPSTPEEFQQKHAAWVDFLAHPQTQAALLQFAASVVQPVDRGQSVVGNIGLAVGDAAQAAGRVGAAEAAGQQQAFENQMKVEGAQAQTAAENRRLGLEEKRITQEGAAQDRSYQLDLERLGIEKSRAAAYSHYISQLGGASTKKIPGYDIAIKTAIQGLDPEDPDFQTKLATIVAGVNQSFGVGGAEPAGGGAAAAPTDPAFDAFLSTLAGGDGTKVAMIKADPQALAEARQRFAAQGQAAPGGPAAPTVPQVPAGTGATAGAAAGRPAAAIPPAEDPMVAQLRAEVQGEVGKGGKPLYVTPQEVEAEVQRRLKKAKGAPDITPTFQAPDFTPAPGGYGP